MQGSRSFMGPRVLVVGGGPFQVEIIESARALGAEVVVVDRNATAPGMRLADRPLVLDIRDVTGVTDAAERLGVDAVVTAASDLALEAVSSAAESLGLPRTPREVLEVCCDKHRTFERMREAGLRVPETVLVMDAAGRSRAAEAVGGYPLVVKPRRAAGGRGVSIVCGGEDLGNAFELAERHACPGEGVLVQAFLDGPSIGVEAFFWEGRIFRAFVMNDQYRPGFVSPVGHSVPFVQGDQTERLAIASAEDYARAAGLDSGPANFDMRRVGDDVVLLEMNPRLGGNCITDLIRAGFGVDLAHAAICAALGRRPDQSAAPLPAVPTASRLFVLQGRGKAAFAGDPTGRWCENDDVLWVRMAARDGEELSAAIDSWSIAGSCLVRGHSVQQAEALALSVALDVETSISVRP